MNLSISGVSIKKTLVPYPPCDLTGGLSPTPRRHSREDSRKSDQSRYKRVSKKKLLPAKSALKLTSFPFTVRQEQLRGVAKAEVPAQTLVPEHSFREMGRARKLFQKKSSGTEKYHAISELVVATVKERSLSHDLRATRGGDDGDHSRRAASTKERKTWEAPAAKEEHRRRITATRVRGAGHKHQQTNKQTRRGALAGRARS